MQANTNRRALQLLRYLNVLYVKPNLAWLELLVERFGARYCDKFIEGNSQL